MRRTIARALPVTLVAAGLGYAGLVATPAGAATSLPVAGVVASTDDGNVAANTLDGDLGTRWSAQGDGSWIRYDLGAATQVGSVRIAWHRGDERTSSFAVQTSTDGTSWTTVVGQRDSSGTTLQPETYDFADRSARYLRVVGYGNTTNDWNSITEARVLGPETAGCAVPADVLNLTNWKLTLPTGPVEDPTTITQPTLAGYQATPWFTTASSCAAVQFRAAVNGVTTSGSGYPRSELREMTGNGATNASWSSTSGTHTMSFEEAFTNLPAGKPHLVGAQIHDASDDVTVFRLEGTNLYVTNGDNAHHKLVTSGYQLGTRYRGKFVVSGGQVKVYYNDVLQTTITRSFSGAYFKAGAYTQANCTNAAPCGDGNYGQTLIYALTVSHS
ncbi:polysaccharide lyase family 7 protein [Micromonospora mirobrigensis]|uniref:F5/8 type C domain-containing protein n=1 Tax=Micromonospora mirobrigensis TaxID=262898 RepID=A0A1C4X2N7_9ACTN|nr:polysaccharide lyase family 7 protein [Micromonospora mirobrigensis]SCF02709.1 F5/8 type C domain-containing protein [Micromonospora mirobrigensis]